MGKGLSPLQRFILKEAHKKTIVSNADVLIKWYGFKQVYYGTNKFDRHRIGIKRYLIATAAVARTLTRLMDRGLMIRNPMWNWRGNRLTPKGVQTVENLGWKQTHNG